MPWLVSGALALVTTGLQPPTAAARTDTASQPPTAVGTSPAQPSATPRLSAGIALGYGLPQGEPLVGDTLSGNVAGLVPLWFDLNYHLSPTFSAGMYVVLGLGFGADIGWTTDDVRTECSSDTINCPTGDVRSGFHARYHFTPDTGYSPWLGIGLGIDFLTVSIEQEVGPDTQGTEGDIGDIQAWGYEGNVQVGLDIALTPAISVGRFADYSLGRYEGIKLKLRGREEDLPTEDKALHSWLIFGVRGAFAD